MLGTCRTGGGKEWGRQINKELLYRAGMGAMIGNEDIASHAGIVSAIESQPAQLMQIDEFGRFTKTLGNATQSPHLYNIVSVLMKLFTSANSIYRGAAYADRQKDKTVDQPHLCIYGTSVPDSVYESLTTENVTDGFLSRMLVIEGAEKLPEKQKGQRLAQAPDELVAAVRWWGEFRPGGNLANEHPQPAVVPYDDDARVAFDEFETTADKLANSPERVNALWTRAGEKAAKLALLYACSACPDSPRVTLAAVQWACELADYLTRKMLLRASQYVVGSAFEAKRQRTLRVIRDAGQSGISHSHLIQKSRGLTKREREEILESLADAGEVTISKIETGGPGRPGLVYQFVAG